MSVRLRQVSADLRFEPRKRHRGNRGCITNGALRQMQITPYVGGEQFSGEDRSNERASCDSIESGALSFFVGSNYD